MTTYAKNIVNLDLKKDQKILNFKTFKSKVLNLILTNCKKLIIKSCKQKNLMMVEEFLILVRYV